MAIIQIKNLHFTYLGNLTPVFEQVNLDLDTDWRLGLVGRNGRGKTTFLNLLRGVLKGQGSISTPEPFEYFPFAIQGPERPALQVARSAIAPFDEWESEMARLVQNPTPTAMARYGEVEEMYAAQGGYTIEEAIAAEAGKLAIAQQVLQRPFSALSGGERVKLMLAALFLKKHRFLLVDEPTDHLDTEGRRLVARWLATKSGFIVVSHDRAFLDEAVDHILSINRADIELQKGNYTSWRHNRSLQDAFERAENKKLEGSIARLEAAAKRTKQWSDKTEKSKLSGGGTAYNKGPASIDRGHIGHQAAKMMQRSKAIERRQGRELEEKKSLLKNIEEADPVKFLTITPPKERLVTAEGLGLCYGRRTLFCNLNFNIRAGGRIAVSGKNGSGKSSLLKIVLGQLSPTEGRLWRMGGLLISALPQETGFLKGNLQGFAVQQGVDISLFLALLRKLDFEREAFARPMHSYSAGQKRKVCLAASLAKPAHLFVWDEPLNYIDILSREQIEQAVLACKPTLLFVEHDAAFVQKVATGTLAL